MTAASRDDRVSILTFALERNRYCVDAESVAAVLGVTGEHALDDATDPWNAGSVTVAGERVRVVDLARAFASRTATRAAEPKLVVFTGTDDGAYDGWLVDDVDATRTVDPASLEPPRTAARRYVRGRLDLEGEEVLWLDEDAING